MQLPLASGNPKVVMGSDPSWASWQATDIAAGLNEPL
jgi:hypothetical protein